MHIFFFLYCQIYLTSWNLVKTSSNMQSKIVKNVWMFRKNVQFLLNIQVILVKPHTYNRRLQAESCVKITHHMQFWWYRVIMNDFLISNFNLKIFMFNIKFPLNLLFFTKLILSIIFKTSFTVSSRNNWFVQLVCFIFIFRNRRLLQTIATSQAIFFHSELIKITNRETFFEYI